MRTALAILAMRRHWRHEHQRHRRAAYVEPEPTPGNTARQPTKMELAGFRVNPGSADEIWYSKDDTPIRLGDMDRTHLVHTLALILRTARTKGGFWATTKFGALRWFKDITSFNWSRDV